jgi:hypothetical protein
MNALKTLKHLLWLAVVTAACFCPRKSNAEVWQWSVPVESVTSSETQDHPRAFLWVAPECKRLRGLVIGQHNMEEEMIFENPAFRKAMAELNFGIVWATPAVDLFFRFDKGSAEHFDKMLAALATESGYDEIQQVPIVPLGHSAAASYPWNLAAWAPERTLAIVSVSGQWPYYKDVNTPDWGGRTVDGIPGLVTMGEYEAAYSRAAVGLRDRAEHPLTALSMLAEPAGDHFSASQEKIDFIALYIRKAAQYRLPKDWPLNQAPKLRKIDPTKVGWLVERGRSDGRPTAQLAPVDKYKGDPKDAFWTFDKELAEATRKFGELYAGKKIQQLAYVQQGQIVPRTKNHVRVSLKYQPLPEDPLSFKLSATFLDNAPDESGGLKPGDPIGHAKDTSALQIQRICGPVAQTGPDTFSIRFYRMGMNNAKRSNSICFIARHPGDAEYRPMVLESELKFPLVNKDGQPQQITFKAPDTVRYGNTALNLNARSSLDRKVYYYVREGPAEIRDDKLVFTPVPARAKFPVKVTVVAWQWGSPIDPKVQTATPVEQTIKIIR